MRTAKARVAHMPMWHMVRKMGNLNPHTERRYLFSRMTPMLLKYHAAIIATVYAFVLTTAGEEGGKGKRGVRQRVKIGDRVPRLDATIWTRVGSRARRSRRGEIEPRRTHCFPMAARVRPRSRARPPY